MHIPGQEAILCKILAKCLFFRYWTISGSILRDQMLVLSTQLANSVQTTADQSVQWRRESVECTYPGSGSNTSKDISGKPRFAAVGRKRRIFGGKHAFSWPKLSFRVHRPHAIVDRDHWDRMGIGTVGLATVPPNSSSQWYRRRPLFWAHSSGWFLRLWRRRRPATSACILREMWSHYEVSFFL
jgi:hypothetical protein